MAAATSSSLSSSSSFGRLCQYDVFLNFRGEDTRKIFVGHLYKALDQKAINTFIDAEELHKGDRLTELLNAIQKSRISIVVFSQNYASSTWCLKELVKIMECMDEYEQIVVPVFYQVDPSDVRKLKGSFAEGFNQHEKNSNNAADREEVQSWKSALTRATNLTGWDSRKYEDDAKLIEEIVQDIFSKFIHQSSSKSNDGLVGMESHIHEMNSRLCPGVDDVRIVGIWGMGGIGKTTIARAVYDRIACQFEVDCFLENVKEGFSKHGSVDMQEKLVSRMLKEKVRSVGTLDRGSRMIMERLGRKKVFLVLDDVDNLAQIETLLGKHRSFGGGSRIIITTRDVQLLSGADAIYEPQCLADSGARELFMQYAFKTNQPTGEYNHLLRRAIEHAKGLPLVLKVLGAFLDNKSVREWEDVLEKTRKIPHMGIQEVLKTSFDGLDNSEKEIFLDIVFCFKGMKKSYAVKILDSCGFYPHNGLRVLIDRCLVTISCDNLIKMHDLVQEMGWEIVRQESIKEPGKRSRLCDFKDVHHVLTRNTATEAVEIICLPLASSLEAVNLHAEAFVRMTKLRYLAIFNHTNVAQSGGCKQQLIGDLQFLSNELTFLLWVGFPQKSLPSNFQPNNLVFLVILDSHLEQLWEGIKPMNKLELINLMGSEYLRTTPDLTEATNLTALVLEGCIRLIEVHPSISALTNLVELNLKGCRELKSLPSISHMKSLQLLNLSGCSKIDKFPEISEIMEKLLDLKLNETAITELPSSIHNLTGLLRLELRDCRELKILPSSFCQLKSLECLWLSGCTKFEVFPDIEEIMEKLKQLHLARTSIKELPQSIERLQGLKKLNLGDCKSLVLLPDNMCNLEPSGLNLRGCSNLSKFPENMEYLQHLWVTQNGVVKK